MKMQINVVTAENKIKPRRCFWDLQILNDSMLWLSPIESNTAT